MKKIFLLLFLLIANLVHPGRKDSITIALHDAIKNKQQFVKKKQIYIGSLKQMLTADLSMPQEYELNQKLYKEYKKFKIDSAVHYVRKNLRIAEALNSKDLRNGAEIQLANLYSSSGKFRESEQLLKTVNRKKLAPKLLPDYYETYSQFYEHYATNSTSNDYIRNIEIYRDSLLAVLNPASNKYKINEIQRYLYHGKINVAMEKLQVLLSTAKKKDADYAMFSYLMGVGYMIKKDALKEKEYYMISATTDITNSIKDNAALQNLALIYYQLGDVDSAYTYTKSAIEDAIFCKVKFRTLQMSELYSIINTAYLEKEANRKSQLIIYLLLISILSVFLIIAVLYVYKQMKKLSRIREKLSQTGERLSELNAEITSANNQLTETNAQLSESNHIKEEYIAHFFDLCSTYINKLERYRLALNKKAMAKQHDELLKMLKSTDVIDNEVDELYNTFDSIFLNLYPTFVKDFNALLIKEEEIVLKQGELLNTELRIFALIRLGITDSVKIAAFLRYSISTIYNYRTKTRNKAAVSRDTFEVMVSKIGISSSRL